jgi:hypothetical protein
MEMIVGVRLEEDLVSIPPIGRKIPAKLDRVVGKAFGEAFLDLRILQGSGQLLQEFCLLSLEKKKEFLVFIRALIGCACVESENITVYSLDGHQWIKSLY